MEYLIGLILSVAVAGFATAIGLDRERAFYPTVLIVIASYYVLFAAMGGSSRALLAEIIVASGFLLMAVLGFRRNLWLAVTAMVGHGVFDFVHHWFIENPGVPGWWPGFCLTCDVIIGGWLAVRLKRGAASAVNPNRDRPAESHPVAKYAKRIEHPWLLSKSRLGSAIVPHSFRIRREMNGAPSGSSTNRLLSAAGNGIDQHAS